MRHHDPHRAPARLRVRPAMLQVVAIIAALGAAGCCCPGGPAIPTASLRARLEVAPVVAPTLSASAAAHR